MSPQFVSRFWAQVEKSLIKRHGLTPFKAKGYVRKYRKELARLGVGETVYNRGTQIAVESVSRTIDQDGMSPVLTA